MRARPRFANVSSDSQSCNAQQPFSPSRRFVTRCAHSRASKRPGPLQSESRCRAFIPEPARDAPRIEPGEIELALIPALAVDPRGYRIGYGGGYYDRLIPRLSKACTCALAYDFQLISEVPELHFDVAVELVVTDARVIRVR